MFHEYKDKPVVSLPCSDELNHALGRKIMGLKQYLTLSKIHTIFIIFTGLGVMHIISSISDLRIICSQGSIETKRSSSADAGKPVYWLSAKNPDSGYMKHVQETFKRVGYERWDEKTGSWDVMWSYEYPFGKKVLPTSLKPHQRVNHFPGSGYLTSKGYLAKSKSRFIPLAFSLPQDEGEFRSYIKQHPEKMWVQKSNLHRGIRIKSAEDLDFNAPNSFIQEFVSTPYLVDGHKFDIGIYTVISSIDPLLIYVLDTEWLIRYCPEKYEPFDPSNPKKYVVEDDYTPTWQIPSLMDGYKRGKISHKESLLLHIKRSGHDPLRVKNDLYDAVAEIILEKQPNFISALSEYPYGSRSFFELVRFDFVLDKDMKVYLMEVNMSPNLSSGHFTDNARMYRQVMFNTLSLVGVASNIIHGKSYDAIDEQMAVSEYDLVPFTSQCAKCTSCDDEVCKLCNDCMMIPLKNALKMVYLQHRNRKNFKRIFPAPLKNSETAARYDVSRDRRLHTDADKAVALWFKGKCMEDDAWCI